MSAKKAINWTEIQARYISGQEPRVIAPDYKDLTPNKITQKANRDGWGRQKQTIREEVVGSIKEHLKQLCELNVTVHVEFLKKLSSKNSMDTITNPYLFDGERVNSLYQTTMNNATKLTLAVIKGDDEDEDNEYSVLIKKIVTDKLNADS